MGALVDALDRKRSFLQGAGVLPRGFAVRRLENGYAVRQGRSVDPVPCRASCQPHLPLSLAPDLVSKEGAGFEEVVA